MALRLVPAEKLCDLLGKRGIFIFQRGRNILMYRALTHSEISCRLAHRGTVTNEIFTEFLAPRLFLAMHTITDLILCE